MEKRKYEPREIEKKWQRFWMEKELFKATIDPSKPKYYVLDMFPYPSGAGLHVGHVTGYTGTDILARYKRQKGFNVLHPMGWDSFGLPAEQYAIRTGTHPKETTQKNIDTYRRQLQSLGFSYDWSREIATSDSSYYKWTQWIFTLLYEKGLAYQAEINVNFCPALGTVLANEEIENGCSKEGGYPIERRPLKQWILRITAYADRLLADLDLLDWPDYLKKLQAHWIGRSEGALISFVEECTKEPIVVFTTRSDTLFGATYLVLAPEHPLVDRITTREHVEAVEEYRKWVSQKSDFERTELSKEKTGVWTGSYALHPITGNQIPIWIADYVLSGYGTGAVMAVPSHDDRDFAFAQKMHLPLKRIYEPDLSCEENPEDVREEILSEKRAWMGDGVLIESEYEDLHLNGLSMVQAKEQMISYLERHSKGERTIHYKLRDWLFSRQRYWGEPMPILHFADGSKRALALDELPLEPPSLKDFKPAATGESPLAKVKEWIEVDDPKTGKKALRETNTMPQWAGSCWYYLRFCDPLNEQVAWSETAEQYWMPVDLYVGGVEHAVLHLLYARFWHKVLYDLGLVHTAEPFAMLRNQGLLTAPSYKLKNGGYVHPDDAIEKEGTFYTKNNQSPLIVQMEKMSKSKLNGITPDEMIEEFGADALRLYEMFMGPFEKEKVWNTDAVSGCKRFLNRFFDLFYSEKVTDEESVEALKLGHRLVDGVSKDIEEMQFNTAIAKMMEFLNDFSPLPSYPRSVLKRAVQMLYPFAPHIAEELWESLGEKDLLVFSPLMPVDPAYLEDAEVTYIVQINGKLRGRFQLPKGKSQEELLEFAQSQREVAKHMQGEIRKMIYIPDKLLNIVMK